MSKRKGYLKRIARVEVPKGARVASVIIGPVAGDVIDRTVEYQRYLNRRKRANVFAKAVLLDDRARVLHVGDETARRNDIAAVAYGLAKEAIRLSDKCDDTAVAAVGIAYRCAGWCGWKTEAVDVLKMFGQKASARP